MECPCWLSVLLVVFLSIPAFGSECSICQKINKGRRLVCLQLCKSASQTERPALGAVALNTSEENKVNTSESIVRAKADKRRSYPMEHFRWSKPHRNKTQERRPGSRNAKRGYSIEHFRWGKPHRTVTPKLGHRGSKRSPYVIEHFRWNKPVARKHKPVKIFTFLTDIGGSPQAVLHPQARSHLNSKEDRSQMPARPQGRKTRLQRGSPENADMEKTDVNNAQGVLADMFRDILLKDVERIVG
ncbi:pro-opiomelanocortin-like [Hippocampus zosterae]|uniref:pro-opiomelanocortin-like n=1 Tax=Hippocampus zosterae TaxID=109293 RepID=UPI00223D41AC|nr:pro-opiomelanocortin-like [Hippocampus zosterae]